MIENPRELLETRGFNQLTRGRHGYFLYNQNDIYLGRAIRDYGEFSELETQVLAQLCQPGDHVAEVGANIGAHTLALARRVGSHGRIYAYEPERIIFQTLCANIALNSLTQVECVHAAVGASPGFIKLPELDYTQEGHYGGLLAGQFEHGQNVPVVALDEVLTPPSLALLKVELAGMEAEVLRGAKNLIAKHRPVIYCENDQQDKSANLIRLLFDYGYRAWWHLPPLYNPKNYFKNPKDNYPGGVSVNMLCVHRSVTVNMTGADEVLDPAFHPMRHASGG